MVRKGDSCTIWKQTTGWVTMIILQHLGNTISWKYNQLGYNDHLAASTQPAGLKWSSCSIYTISWVTMTILQHLHNQLGYNDHLAASTQSAGLQKKQLGYNDHLAASTQSAGLQWPSCSIYTISWVTMTILQHLGNTISWKHNQMC